MFIKNVIGNRYYQFYNKPNISVRNRIMAKYKRKIFDISRIKPGISNIKRLLISKPYINMSDEEREDVDDYVSTLYYTTGDRFLNRLVEFFNDVFSTRKYPIRSRVARYSLTIQRVSKIPTANSQKPISSHVKGGQYGKNY